MASKQPKEDRHAQSQLVPRCLVLVLKAKRDRRSSIKQHQNEPRELSPGWRGTPSPGPVSPQPGGCPANGPASPTESPSSGGKGIFESFQKENSGCYWNPHLEESIQNLKYMGVIHPNTLLVCGRDIYLDTVRNAFARKVLLPPVGFSLHKIGELDPVVMSLVQQTQFTPLPEALCVVIHELTSEGQSATLDTVQDRLTERYKGMQAPPEEIVYETLGSLMKERKIYHTGSAGTGYFIVTPDTYKNGCFNQAHLNTPTGGASTPLPTVFLPLLSPPSTEMRSISCQTEQKETQEEKSKGTEKEEKKKSKLERSQSLKGKSNKEKKAESLGRTASLRLGDEKAKQVIKDINLRTSEAHQDKDKGEKEKTSLFNKIFGRGKSRRSVAIEEEVQEEPEIEYATFSAQFPPPEWAWYEAQIPHATSRMTSPTSHMTSPTSMTLPPQMTLSGMTSPQQHPPAMMRAHTWHHGQGVPHFDAGTQSEFDDEDYMKPRPHPDFVNGFKHGTTGGGHHPHPHHHQPHHWHHSQHHQPQAQYQGNHGNQLQVTPIHHQSSSSHSHESHSSSYEISPPPRSPRRNERDSHRRHRTSSKPRRHHESLKGTVPATLAATPPIANQNEYVQHEDDSHIYCEPSNPADMHGYGMSYEDAALSRGVCDRLTPNAESRTARTLPPKTQNGHSLNNGFVKAEHLPRSKSLTSPNRQKAKYRDLQCPSFCGNDISIEYNGRMPRKNGMFSLSRDSGVNCVGVKDSNSGGNNNLSLKDKKLAFLNNQTGASGSRGSTNGGVNLNNHIPVENGGTPAQPRPTLEHSISHNHQDSGFSSPRTDAEHVNYSGELMNSLPLSNISADSNNTSNNNRRSSASDQPKSRSLSRGPESKTRENITRSSSIGQRNSKDHAVGHGSGEHGKENRSRVEPAFKSLESIHITSSEKYPSYGQLHITEEKDNMTGSSRSGSSKTTVVEKSGDGGLAHGGGGAFLPYDANMSHASSDATYMEIQLVTSDCPVHGNSPQVTPRAHRVKDPDMSVKRHSLVKSTRHHTNQWRHSSAGQNHYGNINLPGSNNNNNTEKDGKMHPASKSRLAFLGDCEVVGIL